MDDIVVQKLNKLTQAIRDVKDVFDDIETSLKRKSAEEREVSNRVQSLEEEYKKLSSKNSAEREEFRKEMDIQQATILESKNKARSLELTAEQNVKLTNEKLGEAAYKAQQLSEKVEAVETLKKQYEEKIAAFNKMKENI